MVKAGKFYCHYEAAEVTMPFVIEPGLTFATLADSFCAKYNAKHGAGPGGQISAANVELKTGGKAMVPSDEVAQNVSPGDDVYVSICPGVGKANGTENGAAHAAAAAPEHAAGITAAPPSNDAAVNVPRAVGEKLAKKLKVYVHYESAVASKDPTATSVCVVEDSLKSVGDVIIEFAAGYNAKHAGVEDFEPLEPLALCARTDSQLVVPCQASVASTFKNGDDIWVVSLEEALKENNEVATVEANANVVQASQQSRKEKSYYYWAQKPTHETPAPREAPKQIRTREARQEELLHFKTVGSYSFEDDGGFVKVYILFKDIGALADESVVSEFDERSCCVKIMGYQGFNHRLQVPKLSEEIVPELSSVKKRKDSILIKLAKKKKDHHWYELFKTKGIGED
mmetsp:Transcript_55650/g.90132  ORF Transcript_55650/g.90132 Transcript_55650/m.90132 type:complete len:398 (+) Transcript_55650:79-1272(+)|eukprot:CAMPEP_0179437434 /NCGR_PEP_ID=MMETSP0799-20121207/21330_1 /TAXON_ID=46947 /ORGANISM="Geminigera cryophila, Strain CCMP2564" /LENGTH=397 /DNA_ID=CAMNT_0021218373 /DNA_START=62 /DNA_END=1255 /DNA_ORIENTATION=+